MRMRRTTLQQESKGQSAEGTIQGGQQRGCGRGQCSEHKGGPWVGYGKGQPLSQGPYGTTSPLASKCGPPASEAAACARLTPHLVLLWSGLEPHWRREGDVHGYLHWAPLCELSLVRGQQPVEGEGEEQEQRHPGAGGAEASRDRPRPCRPAPAPTWSPRARNAPRFP